MDFGGGMVFGDAVWVAAPVEGEAMSIATLLKDLFVAVRSAQTLPSAAGAPTAGRTAAPTGKTVAGLGAASEAAGGATPTKDAHGASTSTWFGIANTEKDLDLSNQPLILALRSGKSLAKVDSVTVEVWLISPLKAIPSFPLCTISGAVTHADGKDTLTFSAPQKTPSSKQYGGKKTGLEQEPGWDTDTPLFGFEATLNITALDAENLTIVNGNNLRFRLPTLRFCEMAASNTSTNYEKVSLQIGCAVGTDSEVSGKVQARHGSFYEALTSKLSADGLSFVPDFSTKSTKFSKIRGYTNSAKKFISFNLDRLDPIVIHCTAASSPQFVGWNKDDWKKWTALDSPTLSDKLEYATSMITYMFDPETIIDVWNGYGASANYLIGRDGKIIELVSPSSESWHSGNHRFGDKFQPKNWGNMVGVGIELAGHGTDFRGYILARYGELKVKTDDDSKAWVSAFKSFVKEHGGGDDPEKSDTEFWGYTTAQYKALGALIKTLGERYGYYRVCNHEWLKDGKFDPGSNFKWDQINSSLVAGEFSKAAASGGIPADEVGDAKVWLIKKDGAMIGRFDQRKKA